MRPRRKALIVSRKEQAAWVHACCLDVWGRRAYAATSLEGALNIVTDPDLILFEDVPLDWVRDLALAYPAARLLYILTPEEQGEAALEHGAYQLIWRGEDFGARLRWTTHALLARRRGGQPAHRTGRTRHTEFAIAA